MYDIIIIGAGPAGLTAAIYARRSNKNILVLEASAYGGQIINANNIENYPTWESISGVDFANKIYDQAKSLGAEIKFEKAVDINDFKTYKEVITNKNKYEAKTVIIATGSDNRKLGLDGEDELLGKGISYCATCDGNFFKEKDVAIAGGGDASLDDALFLSDIVNKVYLITYKNELKGEEKEIIDIKGKDNIEIIYNSKVTKLISDNTLKQIEITSNEGEKNVLDVSGLFIDIGRVPENQNFGKLINLDEKGYVIANEDCHTNISGIFVAGDNRTKDVRQLVTAESDGAISAIEAMKYINNMNN